jgi:thiol:disulfide interchange protein DsbD
MRAAGTKRPWALAGVALTAALMATAATRAQESRDEGRHVTASLIGESRNVVPGRPLHLALRQQIQPGWHTYWSNPGEAGLPTTIDWSLPPGFQAGAIAWPTPVRFSSGPVVGYGYADEVVLPVIVEVPADLRPGADVTLSAHVSWLVCSDTCIPEDADLNISLPVGSNLEPDPNWIDAFASARAHAPRPNPFPTTATSSADQLTLRVAMGDATRLRNVIFFPAEVGVIDDGAPQSVAVNSQALVLTLRRDKTRPPPEMLSGVLAFDDTAAGAGGTSWAMSISAPVGSATSHGDPGIGFIAALLLALAGGIVLNLMPCVLPILSIKALALVQHSQSTPREMRLQGIAYAAGVLASFAVVAAALLGLRAAGAEVGWGFQLQSPLFISLMIYLLFAVGLNLSGVFTIGGRMTGLGSELAARDGYAGSYCAGALATVVATPCTAPFMATAIGYAVTQPWYISIAVLEAIGLGLALPYLVVTFIPRMQRLLPRPGAWMLRLKQALAFPVYGTAVWLIFVLSQQTGAAGITAALAGLVLIAFAAWLYDIVYLSAGSQRRWGIGASALAVASAFALLHLVDEGAPVRASPIGAKAGLEWQPFSLAKLDALRAEGRPVFVDFTAAWCVTCVVNERIALADPDVVRAFVDGGIAALKADWTRRDADITQILEANGRAGIPLYLFYPKAKGADERKPPVLLPQILTVATVLRTIQEQ